MIDQGQDHDSRLDLPITTIGAAGPQRDHLTRLVLEGAKTATASLLHDWVQEGEPLPTAGARYRMIDSRGEVAAVVEITAVRICRFDEVDDRHAEDEGEGDATADAWRFTHAAEWPGVAGDTLVVLERFRIITRP